MASDQHYCIYENDIKNIKKILQGNGDPDSGLCVRIAIVCNKMDTLNDKMDTLIEKKKEEKSNRVMIVTALIASFASVIGTIAGVVLS